MGAEQVAVLQGVTILKAYLDSTGQSISAFAREHRLDGSELSKLLRGERSRVSVEMAQKIQEATDGYVRWDMWVP